MPMTCARCGAQNPDGNQFCSACGTPLTQAPPQGPPPPAEAAPSWLAAPPQAPPPPAATPPAYASPQPAEVAYASPYYSPSGAMPQAPVHRTPMALIIGESIKSKAPDAVECRAVRPTDSTIGGVKGISWHMCFTVVSSVHSVPAEASLFVATNADGSVWYGVILVTPQSYMVNLTSEAEPIIQGIVWKLT